MLYPPWISASTTRTLEGIILMSYTFSYYFYYTYFYFRFSVLSSSTSSLVTLVLDSFRSLLWGIVAEVVDDGWLLGISPESLLSHPLWLSHCNYFAWVLLTCLDQLEGFGDYDGGFCRLEGVAWSGFGWLPWRYRGTFHFIFGTLPFFGIVMGIWLVF